MTMKSVTNSYANKVEILQFPDDYVARPQFFDEQSKLAVKDESGRYIIKAGTPFPSNDANCTGIVLNDLDVTDGDENGAVLVRGHINTDRAEANFGGTYTSACKNALKSAIFFYPLGGTVQDETIIDSTSKIVAGAVNPYVILKLEGTDFAPKQASELKTNYTITAGTTALELDKVTRLSDKVVRLNFTGTAVAGTLKIQAKAVTVVNGVASNELSLVIA